MKTLRRRFFWYLLICAVLSTALAVVLAGIVGRRFVERQALQALEARASGVAAELAADPTAGPRIAAELRTEGVLALFPNSRLGLRLSGRSGVTEIRGRRVLFATADSAQGPIVLVRASLLSGREGRVFVFVVLLAALAGAAVAALLASILSKRLTKPLSQLSDATRRVASGDRSVQVPVTGTDELATLATSFNQMSDRLARSRDSERAFLLSVSHELKTPLTAIRGYGEALRDGAATPEEAGAVIEGESERLRRLVQDLLDLARLDQRQFAVKSEPVDLGEVARTVEERARPRAAEFGVRLEAEPTAQAIVAADRDRTIQVASNLVDNALRATPAGGTVTVRADGQSIYVEDTGPGLTPDDVAHAFDRFFLYRRYGADRPVGSGLGLAIVKELTAMMGGTVAVRSEPGAGSVFEVRLPPIAERPDVA